MRKTLASYILCVIKFIQIIPKALDGYGSITLSCLEKIMVNKGITVV